FFLFHVGSFRNQTVFLIDIDGQNRFWVCCQPKVTPSGKWRIELLTEIKLGVSSYGHDKQAKNRPLKRIDRSGRPILLACSSPSSIYNCNHL
ncbi:MAG: hypothetical protein PVF59_10385, partial [Desulfobacterales bacterium]